MNIQCIPVVLVLGTALGSGLVVAPVSAQEIDNTQTLPDAKPGECYAKVITPAEFEERTEDVVIQAAAERIEPVPAKYETIERSIVTREAGKEITVSETQLGDAYERVETRPAELNWTQTLAEGNQPASPGALEGIIRSGVELDSVEPGTCFREYFTQAQYRTETQRVLKQEGSEIISVVPATYETVDEQVVIREASTRVVDVPAVYRTESESVLVEPARSVWSDDCGLIEQIANGTGDVVCLKEIPARYETITKTVLDKPASTRVEEVPAEYRTIKVQRLVSEAAESREEVPPVFAAVTRRTKTADAGFFWVGKDQEPSSDAEYSGQEVCLSERPAEFVTIKQQVIKTPTSAEVIVIPEQTETVEVERLLEPARERRIGVPAKVKTVTRTVQIEPSRLEWRPVLCQTNMTPKIVIALQRALEREGYNPGPVDGVIGQATLAAIEKYQEKNNLDRGGLTYETLKSLEIQS